MDSFEDADGGRMGLFRASVVVAAAGEDLPAVNGEWAAAVAVVVLAVSLVQEEIALFDQHPVATCRWPTAVTQSHFPGK